MRITILRRTEYKGCPVYALRFATVFQYFFYCKGKLYQDHIFVTPRRIPRILYFLHLIGDDRLYSKDEIDSFEEVILNGALTSIDKLNEKKDASSV